MKKYIRRILFLICIIACIAGVTYIVWYFWEKEQNQDVYQRVQRQVERTKIKKPKDIIPIDFEALKQINPDIYAWIDIPDTNIHYPIVQSADDDTYYLNYTIEGKKGYPGSIYTEKINAKDFSDFNTVVYGHDMKNGTMFKHLHKFENPEFFEQHDKVIVYTETERKMYRIFAAVVYDDRHLMYSYDYNNPEERKNFLQSVFESRNMKNQFRSGVQVDENSHILTLSTCISGQPDKRFLVEAVEIDE